ncbi:lambda exonuclease family protein [Sphingomonas sp.]|uniref:lambda exonuclease family protein n=1 Tax=Sphingomonas sp. TaxID=28214 RepID=UPI003F6E5A46
MMTQHDPALSDAARSHVKYHADLIQGSDEWLQQRCGLLTASEMKLILTPTLKVADNDKTRAHVFELLFQRMTGFVEPHYVSDDMLRGHDDEIEARMLYGKHYAPVREVGFITNDRWGFTIGFSPDGLVGTDGLIECKSRRGKYQVQTIAAGEVPAEYMLQLQTGLLVTERKWVDFVSYSGGLPMFVKRVEADPVMQAAIVAAAAAFEARIAEEERNYRATLATMPVVIETERRVEQEMYV